MKEEQLQETRERCVRIDEQIGSRKINEFLRIFYLCRNAAEKPTELVLRHKGMNAQRETICHLPYSVF